MLKKITFVVSTVVLVALVAFGVVFFASTDVQRSMLDGSTFHQYMQQQERNIEQFQNAMIETISQVE
ncbi:MAG: hypothetical protein ACOX60_09345 [Massiliimalia sp.]|jgi:uncharacterized membrane protein